MNLFAFDDEFRRQGYAVIAGIDEAGRGCLAGPVVAACVSFREKMIIDGIRDSKELTAEHRERLFQEILENAFVGIGIVNETLIDRVNILKATKIAMTEAFFNLDKEVDLLLIDAISLPEIKKPQRSIVKGDQKSALIASASIVAKVTRDKIMANYHEIYPQYGFNRHKGYATKEHIDAIRRFGPCPIHRKSFSPVRDLMLF